MSATLLIRTCACMLSTAFCISLVVFIVLTRSKDRDIASPFFLLFTAVTLSDILQGLARLTSAYIPQLLSNAELVLQYVPCQAKAIYDYCSILKVLGSMLIDLNRYTCFCFPMRHKKIWSGCQLKAAFVFLVTAPCAICGYRVANACYYRIANGAMDAFMTDNASEVTWTLTNATLYTLFSLTGFAFTVLTIVRICRMRETSKIISLRKDIDVRLFAYSVAVLCVQQSYTAYFLARTPFLAGSTFQHVVAFIGTYAIWEYLMYLCPIFIFVLSPHVRRKYLAFYRVKSEAANGVSFVAPSSST